MFRGTMLHSIAPVCLDLTRYTCENNAGDTALKLTQTDGPEPWKPGTVVAEDLTVVRRLGQGGFAAVYEAKAKYDNTIALKRLFEKHSTEHAVIEAFKKEAAAMKRLKACDYVVKVYEVGQSHDRHHYFSMEFMDASLADVLDEAEGGRLPVERCLEITSHVLQALQASHKLSIRHLDVKPENILFSSKDGRKLAKLTDFGIAVYLEETDSNSRHLRTMHTAGYSPPEQMDPAHLRRNLGATADLYAVGMTLYRMLIGRAPFKHDDDDEKWEMFVQGSEVGAPSRHRTEIREWPGLDDFVLKLTEQDPEERFQTVEEALLALNQLGPKGNEVRAAEPKDRIMGAPSAPFRVLLGLQIAAGVLLLLLFWSTARLPAERQASIARKEAIAKAKKAKEVAKSAPATGVSDSKQIEPRKQ